MLNLILPPDISGKISAALEKAGKREVGGVLLAEHVGPDEFAVRDITVHRRGAISSFVRVIEEALGRIAEFFQGVNHDYVRFNYLGEWHSHLCHTNQSVWPISRYANHSRSCRHKCHEPQLAC